MQSKAKRPGNLLQALLTSIRVYDYRHTAILDHLILGALYIRLLSALNKDHIKFIQEFAL